MTDEQMFKLRLEGMTETLQRLRPERYVYFAAYVFFAAFAASVIFKALFGAQVDMTGRAARFQLPTSTTPAS